MVKQTTWRLGGTIVLHATFQNCHDEIRYHSDPDKELPHQVVAACHSAGIRQKKLTRFNVALGWIFSSSSNMAVVVTVEVMAKE